MTTAIFISSDTADRVGRLAVDRIPYYRAYYVRASRYRGEMKGYGVVMVDNIGIKYDLEDEEVEKLT